MVIACAATPAHASAPAWPAAFERYLTQNIVQDLPGAAVIMVNKGRVVRMKTWGVREAGKKATVTADTVFRLASVSKSFAATAAGLQVERGKLRWNSPVLETLNDPNVIFKRGDYGQQLTLSHLLSHTTGLMPQAYTNLIEAGIPYQKVVKRLREVDFVCPPGRCYGYQNVVFSLAGDMIEKTSGQAYNTFMQKNLLTPLSMMSASSGYKAFLATENRATPHVKGRKRWWPARVLPTYYRVSPAAGINASIRDMGQWLKAQLGLYPQVLSSSLLDQVQAPQVRNSRRQSHFKPHRQLGAIWYGRGWRVFNFGPYRNFVYHGGWVKGSRALMLLNRELQIGMVFLTNAETRKARKVLYRFLELYLASQRDK
ncbi:MAG: beta-lactamase family protein [Marinobacterium sp.]|nr:beta-lactamase family protein [Marinobacterium sp.]